jgi:demethylmenaquinone methyltransferase/2-methoxy-6-polyprenyl-1,4-benzoquinol methylase
MFSSLAGRYDLANTLLSLGTHKYWRPKLLALGSVGRGMRVLDCACGTGDVALAALRLVGPSGEVVGCDFSEEMLSVARTKAAALTDSWLMVPGEAGQLRERLRFEHADVLALPYPDGGFDVATVAFGVRNFDDPARGLAEMARVVKPGGRVVVLETGLPKSPLVRTLYRQYTTHHLPAIGALVTGNRAAYEYLHRTVWSFPYGNDFDALMQGTGRFSSVLAQPLAGGLSWLYRGNVK